MTKTHSRTRKGTVGLQNGACGKLYLIVLRRGGIRSGSAGTNREVSRLTGRVDVLGIIARSIGKRKI